MEEFSHRLNTMLGIMHTIRLTVAFALLTLLLTACDNHIFPDQMAGTWTNKNADTMTFTSDGAFSTGSSSPATSNYQGTWQITNGTLISTITNAPEKFTRPVSFKIMRLDEHTLSYKAADKTFTWSR